MSATTRRSTGLGRAARARPVRSAAAGRDLRLAAAVAACLGLAALSLLRPSAPTTDPWGWIVWGRELLALDLHTDVAYSPAWKPLPVLLTTPLALLGDLAPAAWLVLSRAGGLAALALAYLLGVRFGGRIAGVLAAAALALSNGFLRALEHGYTEPLMAALLLGAVDRHLAGRRHTALALGVLVGLGRPEILALLVLYAAWLWRRDPAQRRLTAALPAAVPLLWFGPDWWGSGNPFYGGGVASGASADVGGLGILEAAVLTPGAAVVMLALAAMAWRRPNASEVAQVAALTFGWIAFLALIVEIGYPASERFVAVPVALLCVLAGAGAAGLIRALRSSQAPRVAAAHLAAAGLVALLFALHLHGRVESIPAEVHAAEERARVQNGLRERVAAAAGSGGSGCVTVGLPPQLGWNAGAIAWELRLPMAAAQGEACATPGDL